MQHTKLCILAANLVGCKLSTLIYTQVYVLSTEANDPQLAIYGCILMTNCGKAPIQLCIHIARPVSGFFISKLNKGDKST